MAGQDNKVKLYGVWASGFSKMVEIALKMKGVDYEIIEEDLSNKSPDLLKLNPVHKKIPVLVHNGKPIAESMVIIEYIDETWKSGTAILPADPYDRAMARFWADFITAKCMLPTWRAHVSSDEEESKKLAEEAAESFRILEKQLADKKFFGGESVGYMDIAAILMYWVEVVQEVTGKKLVIKEDDFPLLCKWKDEVLDWSIARETLPPKDKLVAFYKARYGSPAK